jgi:hypothetical protein
VIGHARFHFENLLVGGPVNVIDPDLTGGVVFPVTAGVMFYHQGLESRFLIAD